MPLSHFTRQLIEIKHSDLVSRIEKHESGEQLLIPEAIADYRNDESMLYKLLTGKYEELELEVQRLYRQQIHGSR